jgi:hypothetical protein
MFDKTNMIYSDYWWNSPADISNPTIIQSTDNRILNRLEGYEMIYYIRSLARSWEWKDEAIRACQKIEKTIREKVPQNIRTYAEIKAWIENNFKTFWDTLLP